MTKIQSQKKLKHEQVQYIEFLSTDINRAKKFYTDSFRWKLRITGRDTPLSKATMLMAALLPASQLTEVF